MGPNSRHALDTVSQQVARARCPLSLVACWLAVEMSGCYLTFDPASGGVMHATWSHDPVEGAWAFAEPRKKVPGFKFKQNGGRVELVRNCGAVGKKNMFNGWAQFFKLAYDYDSEVVVQGREVDLWFSSLDRTVHSIEPGTPVLASDINIIAVMPHDSATFQGVKIMPDNQFQDFAKAGYSIKFN